MDGSCSPASTSGWCANAPTAAETLPAAAVTAASPVPQSQLRAPAAPSATAQTVAMRAVADLRACAPSSEEDANHGDEDQERDHFATSVGRTRAVDRVLVRPLVPWRKQTTRKGHLRA